jgi:hypothetical protein
MERRERFRYNVHANVEFRWMDAAGVCHVGRGVTKDITSKGIFICSDTHPPEKADVAVNVSIRNGAEQVKKLELGADSVVIRVELAAGPKEYHGFAVLNRSYKLYAGGAPVEELEEKFDA